MNAPTSRTLIALTAWLATTAPVSCLAQSRDQIVVDAQRRIESLTRRFLQAKDGAQTKLDAANCRVDCPSEVSSRIRDEMKTAFDEITAAIHSEVDSYVRRTVAASGERFNLERLQSGLRTILPKSGDLRSVYEGNSPDGRYLIVVYAFSKGGTHGTGATAVMVRAYSASGGLRLSDVAGSDMEGYASIVADEIHPPVSPGADSTTGAKYFLLSGYMTGANGPNNRMRLYAFDGRKFRSVWMPENVWGHFTVQPTRVGFVIDGDYYRASGKRHDEYVLSDDGVYLVR